MKIVRFLYGMNRFAHTIFHEKEIKTHASHCAGSRIAAGSRSASYCCSLDRRQRAACRTASRNTAIRLQCDSLFQRAGCSFGIRKRSGDGKDDGNQRNDIIQLANVFRAQIIDVSIETLTLAVIGDSDKITAIENILKEFNILEIARTGGIALERGKATIHDETKERGEFNYGKNVL